MQLKSAIGGNLERPELRTTLLTSAAVGNLFLLVLVIYFDFCFNSILSELLSPKNDIVSLPNDF